MTILSVIDVQTMTGITGHDAQIAALLPGVETYVQRRANTYVLASLPEIYDGAPASPISSNPLSLLGPNSWAGDIGRPVDLSTLPQGATQLVLRRVPVSETVSSPVSIQIATDAARTFGDEVPRGDYYIDAEAGIVTYESGFPSMPSCIRVTYPAGIPAATYPDDLKIVIAGAIARAVNTMPASGIKSESAGSYSYTMADAPAASAEGVRYTDFEEAVLEDYANRNSDIW